MKKSILITMSLLTALQAGAAVNQGDVQGAVADTRSEVHEQIMKKTLELSQALTEIRRVRGQIEELKEEIRNTQSRRNALLVLSAGTALVARKLFHKKISGDLLGFKSFTNGMSALSLSGLAVLGVGVSVKDQFQIYVKSDELEMLEERIVTLEETIEQQLRDLEAIN